MRARQRSSRLSPRYGRASCLAVGLTALCWLAAVGRAEGDPPFGEPPPLTGPVLRRPDALGAAQPALRRTATAQTLRDPGVLQSGTRCDEAASTPTPPLGTPGQSRPGFSGAVQRATPATSIQPVAPLPEPPGVLWRAEPFHRHPEPQYDEKPIGALTTNILPGRGDLPANYAAARFDKAGCELHVVGTSRPWAELVYDWEATSFFCQPLYFEEPNVARVGHSAGYFFQPIVSGAHFFARISALPYMMTAEFPLERVYTLGHDRPGSYAPLRYIRLPVRAGATAAEGAVITAIVFLLK